MIELKLAKSAMEHEEGLNHLWLRFVDDAIAEKTDSVQVSFRLPEGVLRLHNLNGFPEDRDGAIRLEAPLRGKDIVIEMYTLDTAPCGLWDVSAVLEYRDGVGALRKYEQTIPMALVSEGEMQDIVVDEEVVRRVTSMRPSSSERWEFVRIPPMFLEHKEMSSWEKKYRIDCVDNSKNMSRT